VEQASPREPTEWEIPAAFAALVERRGLEFLTDFYRAELDRKPENLEVRVDLGHALTRLGRYAEGLAVDRELAELAPDDPNVLYNLACSLALTGAADEAFRTLDRAILHGYDDPDHLAADEDFAALRVDPRFAVLVESLRRSVDESASEP
jgi:tetratricopeptide (TPR) repeat protein